MGVILIRPWTSQPKVNTRVKPGLSFAANYLSTYAPNLVSGAIPDNANTASLKPDHSGLGIYLPVTNTAGLKYSNTNAIPTNSPNFTIIICGTFTAEIRRANVFFYGFENASPFTQHALLINSDSAGNASSGLISATTYDSGFKNQVQSIAGVIDGNPHTFAWRNGTNADLSLWMDGKDITSTKSGGTYGFATQPLYIGQTDTVANNRGLASPLSGIWIIPRTLTDAEIRAFTINPWQLLQSLPSQLWSPVSAGGGNVTVGATGNTGTFAVGSLLPQIDKVLSGNAGTFAAGSLIPQFSLALTGNTGTFAAGTLGTSDADLLLGNTGTFAVGSLTPSISVPLIGNAGTFVSGSLTPSSGNDVTVAASGNSGSFAIGTLGLSIDIPLIGNAGTFAAGSITYTPADVTVAAVGNSATFTAGILAADTGIIPSQITAGSSKKQRKQRKFVEIKNKLYEVDDLREAEQLINQLGTKEEKMAKPKIVYRTIKAKQLESFGDKTKIITLKDAFHDPEEEEIINLLLM